MGLERVVTILSLLRKKIQQDCDDFLQFRGYSRLGLNDLMTFVGESSSFSSQEIIEKINKYFPDAFNIYDAEDYNDINNYINDDEDNEVGKELQKEVEEELGDSVDVLGEEMEMLDNEHNKKKK